jgi:hypothetical protein
MPENKNKVTDRSVEEYLHRMDDSQKREDSFTLLDLMEEITGMKAQLWGNGIIGFGSYHYRYTSGHEGDAPYAGFAARQGNLMVSFMDGLENYEEDLKKLGKHKRGSVSLYIKRLEDIDLETLKAMIEKSFKFARDEHGD